jgi:adenine-specific DNA-methyltransferase
MAQVRLAWDGRDDRLTVSPATLVVDEQVGADSRNRLVRGDNLLALAALSAYAGTVDLVYIDPPFDSGRSYSAQLDVGGPQPAYDDSWGTAAYLHMLRPRLVALRDLLSDTGVICVHIDHHAGNYVGVLLDEVFGRVNFVNEIIWRYGKMSNATRRFPNNHDRILVYSKTEHYHFVPERGADSEYRNRFARYLVGNQVRYGAVATSADQLVLRRVRQVAKRLDRPLVADDVLFDFDTEFKTQDDVFYDISIVKGNAAENVGFRTQKPVALIARLIAAFCPEGGLVLDAFAGSGTTAVAAAQSGRDFVSIDSSPLAIHTARKRLLAIGASFTGVGLPPSGDAAPSLRPPAEITLVQKVDSVELTLTAPATARSSTGWIELIDYWAVDFGEHDGKPFHVDWYAVRSKQHPSLTLHVNHEYRGTGRRLPRVRVVTAEATTVELTVEPAAGVDPADASAGNDHPGVTP